MGMSSKVVPYMASDDPKPDWVSNFRLWPDPTGQGEWFIERIDTTLEKLKRINRYVGANGQPIYKNLDLLERYPIDFSKQTNSPSARGDAYSNRELELDAVERVQTDTRDEGHEGTPVTLEVCVGLVPYEPEDGIVWRRTVIANDSTIIRDDPNPTPDLKPEYFSSQQIPIPGAAGIISRGGNWHGSYPADNRRNRDPAGIPVCRPRDGNLGWRAGPTW